MSCGLPCLMQTPHACLHSLLRSAFETLSSFRPDRGSCLHFLQSHVISGQIIHILHYAIIVCLTRQRGAIHAESRLPCWPRACVDGRHDGVHDVRAWPSGVTCAPESRHHCPAEAPLDSSAPGVTPLRPGADYEHGLSLTEDLYYECLITDHGRC